MVDRRRIRNPRDRTIFREVARKFNVGEQSLRLWVRQFDAERLGDEPASKPSKANGHRLESVEGELESLRRKIQKLQAENDVLKRAFVVFSSEWSKR